MATVIQSMVKGTSGKGGHSSLYSWNNTCSEALKACHALTEKAYKSFCLNDSSKANIPLDRDEVMRLTRGMKREYWKPKHSSIIDKEGIAEEFMEAFGNIGWGDLRQYGISAKFLAEMSVRKGWHREKVYTPNGKYLEGSIYTKASNG